MNSFRFTLIILCVLILSCGIEQQEGTISADQSGERIDEPENNMTVGKMKLEDANGQTIGSVVGVDLTGVTIVSSAGYIFRLSYDGHLENQTSVSSSTLFHNTNGELSPAYSEDTVAIGIDPSDITEISNVFIIFSARSNPDTIESDGGQSVACVHISSAASKGELLGSSDYESFDYNYTTPYSDHTARTLASAIVFGDCGKLNDTAFRTKIGLPDNKITAPFAFVDE